MERTRLPTISALVCGHHAVSRKPSRRGASSGSARPPPLSTRRDRRPRRHRHSRPRTSGGRWCRVGARQPLDRLGAGLEAQDAAHKEHEGAGVVGLSRRVGLHTWRGPYCQGELVGQDAQIAIIGAGRAACARADHPAAEAKAAQRSGRSSRSQAPSRPWDGRQGEANASGQEAAWVGSGTLSLVRARGTAPVSRAVPPRRGEVPRPRRYRPGRAASPGAALRRA